MSAHSLPRLLDLGDRNPHADCDAALSREAEDNLTLTREAQATRARDALILRLFAYTDNDTDEKGLRAAIHHARLLLGQPGRPDPALVRRLLDDLGGNQ